MKNQSTAKASLSGYALKFPRILFLFVVAASFQACTKQDVVSFPQVIKTSPSPDQANIDLEASVSVVFNREMDSASVYRSFEITSANGPVPGTLEFRDTLFEFIPERELLPNTEYTVRIKKSATDKRGHGMEADYIFHFTTKGPDEYSMTKTSDHVTDFERDGNRIVQIGQYIYSLGGWSNIPEESYNDIYRSNDLVNWEKRPDAPWHGRHVFGLAKLNNAVYVMGGDNLHNEFDVWRTYDGESWTKLADNILGNRIFFGCTAHNGYLYIVGGAGVNDVWKSADGMNWSKIADNLDFLNGENFAGSLTSFNGKLWMVCGGGTGFGSGDPRKSVWSSVDGITWKQEQDFGGSARYYTDVCVWDNKIWVVGGYNYDERNVRSIWYMTPKGAWTELQIPNEFIGRHATAVGVFNNKLVIANGNYHNDCWAIEKIQ